MKVLRRVVCIIIAFAVAFAATSVNSDAAKLKFRTYKNNRYNYKVKVPKSLTSQSSYSNDDGVILKTADGRVRATVYASYKVNKKSAKAIVNTAKKSKKAKVLKATKKEGLYYYKSGDSIVETGVVVIKNGLIQFQMCFPSSMKGNYMKAAKTMLSSMKKNKKLVAQ
ncbi:MAG: hypothetical protein K6G63_03605 [Eubacterium sp.]|nr:hypothetical protein [Eubacterium sp.]